MRGCPTFEQKVASDILDHTLGTLSRRRHSGNFVDVQVRDTVVRHPSNNLWQLFTVKALHKNYGAESVSKARSWPMPKATEVPVLVEKVFDVRFI